MQSVVKSYHSNAMQIGGQTFGVIVQGRGEGGSPPCNMRKKKGKKKEKKKEIEQKRETRKKRREKSKMMVFFYCNIYHCLFPLMVKN